MTFVKRAWIPLVVVVLVAIAGFAVYRLHGVFAARGAASAVGPRADDIKPFNPKRVTMEVFGPAGSVADINYLDVDAAPQRADDMRLPWTYSVATTAPAVSVNVVAQGDGAIIGCRITVNGDIRAQRTVAGIHPQTFCLVKSA
ncbi:MmpS family transport accessory protein [Mycobacterium sp.]|uniref:MmpS family transport accessory protein n=1 Tax=Mycobacterium sp. TaxID=1785 RepID=UPI002C180C22|nr:MmpS family transport accessory protein [Mycobacterium sp.]HTY31734.1 MmpS family transport accessory protein [Mycobacterium sp.]